jgi:hypothetical protein
MTKSMGTPVIISPHGKYQNQEIMPKCLANLFKSGKIATNKALTNKKMW